MSGRHLAVLFICCLPLIGVRAAETVAILDFEPWVVESEDSAGPGMLIELSALAFPGEPVEQHRLPPRRLLAEASAGEFAWIFQACHLPLPHHEIVKRLMTFEQGLLVLSDSPIHRLEDLTGNTVAVWSARFGVVPQLEQDSRIAKVQINDLASGTSMLMEHRVQALLITSLAIGWHLERSDIKPEPFRFVPFQAIEGCLWANKSIPAARRDQVGQRMDAIIADGSLSKLVKRYQGVELAR